MRNPSDTAGVRVAAVWSLLGVLGMPAWAFLTDRGWVPSALFAIAAAGLTLLACAMLTDGVPAGRRRPVLALSWTAALLLLFVLPANLLMRLMFLEPGSGWAVAGGVFSVAGGVCWSWAALAYQRRTGTGCRRCGRHAAPPDTGAPRPVMTAWFRGSTVAAALIPVIGFTVPHWLWALGVPFGVADAGHMRESGASALWGLGLLPLLGAGLTLGLVRPWGQVFPRRAPIVGGRRVPRWLAIVPPAVLGLMLAQYGVMMTRCAGATLVHVTNSCYGYGRGYFIENWAFTGTYPVFLAWGATLFAAAVGYLLSTRPPCTACGSPPIRPARRPAVR